MPSQSREQQDDFHGRIVVQQTPLQLTPRQSTPPQVGLPESGSFREHQHFATSTEEADKDELMTDQEEDIPVEEEKKKRETAYNMQLLKEATVRSAGEQYIKQFGEGGFDSALVNVGIILLNALRKMEQDTVEAIGGAKKFKKAVSNMIGAIDDLMDTGFVQKQEVAYWKKSMTDRIMGANLARNSQVEKSKKVENMVKDIHTKLGLGTENDNRRLDVRLKKVKEEEQKERIEAKEKLQTKELEKKLETEKKALAVQWYDEAAAGINNTSEVLNRLDALESKVSNLLANAPKGPKALLATSIHASEENITIMCITDIKHTTAIWQAHKETIKTNLNIALSGSFGQGGPLVVDMKLDDRRPFEREWIMSKGTEENQVPKIIEVLNNYLWFKDVSGKHFKKENGSP